MTAAEGYDRLYPPASLIVVRRYSGTQIARVVAWEQQGPGLRCRVRLFSVNGRTWTRTERIVVGADILGHASLWATRAQARAMAAAGVR